MDVIPLEVYSHDSNLAVIKPPGRHYPGVVIQGDSFGIVCRAALRAVHHIREGDTSSEEFLGEVEELTNTLLERMLHYQEVLRLHGIDLPHVHPFTKADLVSLTSQKE